MFESLPFIGKMNDNHGIRIEYILINTLTATLVFHYLKLAGPADSILLIVGTTVGVAPVFWNAIIAIREHEWASMDMLASVALIFSIVNTQWASAVFIALMLAAARLLGKITESRMEKNIRSLLKLRPLTAKVDRNGVIETIPVEKISVGDMVIVDTGERIPIDGVVISGEAAIDESSLTGESLPVDKTIDSIVVSSTLVSSGSLHIKTTRIGKDTALERIIALVESSRDEKSAIETMGQKFGKYYLICVFIGAGLLLVITRNVSFVLAVTLVVCADDVAIAIPLAYLRGIGLAAKRGIVIKGGRHLETLGRADTIVFDKTGTLTRGKPKVTAVETIANVSPHDLLLYAIPAAQRSTHPLSRALVLYGKEQGVVVPEAEVAEVIGGRGIVSEVHGSEVIVGNQKFLSDRNVLLDAELLLRATAHAETGKSISFIARDGSALGFFALGDEVKKGAKSVIAELRRNGIKHVIMLSGDNERAAGALARDLGIEEWHANLLPEDKVAKLRELCKNGVVAMVGDGVNDAAALSLAHIGIAMGGLGSDGAIESANIVLMHDNLNAIPEAIELARSIRKISIQDFYIWGATNIFGLTLVFIGFLGPAGAAAYNFISDFFPLFNSARARFPRRPNHHA